MTEREKEIKTIKERTVTLKLSDADCMRIAIEAGKHGVTISRILENFIGDLVDGTYSNGDYEKELVERWMEGCLFGGPEKESLLKHLLDEGYNPQDYITVLSNIRMAKREKKYLMLHPEKEYEEEMGYTNQEIEELEDRLQEMVSGWKPENTLDMSQEMEMIKKWVRELKCLINPKKNKGERIA